MGRKITMTGKNAQYIEHRGANTTHDNDREILMKGDEAVYQEFVTDNLPEKKKEPKKVVQEECYQDKVVDAIHELTDVVKESLKEPRTQNIYGDKNEFQDGAQLLKMGIPEGADPAEIAARIAEQQRALLEQKKQKK